MQKITFVMSFMILLVSLSGCAGSDGEVNVDLSTEEIQDLIDENIDDFLNNTTITVVQHYHNNTTYIDQSDETISSTTNNYNGSSPDTELFVFPVNWDRNASLHSESGPLTNITRPVYYHGGNEFDYGIGSGPISNYDDDVVYVTTYNGTALEITASCIDVVNNHHSSPQQWESWLIDNFGYADEVDSVKYELENFWRDFAQLGTVDDICGTYFNEQWLPKFQLFTINLEEGEAIRFQQIDHFVHLILTCEDGFTGDYGYGGNYSTTEINSLILGGHAICEVVGETNSNSQYYWNYQGEIAFRYTPMASFAVYYEMLNVSVA